MGTCRLARQMALEMWKKDVRAMPYFYKCSWLNEEEKERIMMYLEGLIG